jgi:hypothetical protein
VCYVYADYFAAFSNRTSGEKAIDFWGGEENARQAAR